jgi:hypothetical protein
MAVGGEARHETTEGKKDSRIPTKNPQLWGRGVRFATIMRTLER